MIDKSKYLLVLCLSSFFASCQNSIEQDSTTNNIIEVIDSIYTNNIDTSSYSYAWKDSYDYKSALINLISPPKGYNRIDLNKNSFGDWLRHLPLRENNTVYLYDGEEKLYQYAHFRIIDIDVGDKDLQQCADAVMRLRAEYLYSEKQFEKIHFNYTNGTTIPFSKWSSGLYPSVKGSKVAWVKSSNNNSSYTSFKKYLTSIFMYAGTASLEKELKERNIDDIFPGDVFIKGGFPGHAVIVLDVAINPKTKDRCFMLAQSYMPAQDIHVLQNFENEELSPWYSISELELNFRTPEWTFSTNQLKSFPE